jgi:purine-binding chemotaxis protein CheW
MSTTISATALALRREFDRAFAEAVRAESAAATEDVLAIDVGGHPYAIRLSEVAAVHSRRRVVPVPSAAAELAGIASFRNTLVPVYDLRAWLGRPTTSAASWLVVARAAQVVAFSFDALTAHMRLPAGALVADADGDLARPYLAGAVHADVIRPLIHVPSLIEAIEQRARAAARAQEP